MPGIALGVLAIFGAGYVRTSLMVIYDHPDVPVEPLIYVQSTRTTCRSSTDEIDAHRAARPARART